MQRLIRYGSKDSSDIDILIIPPDCITTHNDLLDYFTQMQYSGNLYKQMTDLGFDPSDVDYNIAIIKNNRIVDGYKGNTDELNNMVYNQFDNFKQPCFTSNPITGLVKRDIGLKIIRTLRGLLSQVSRTKYRKIVKSCLKYGGLYERIDVLRTVYNDPEQVYTGLKTNHADFNKFIAFQTVQCMELIMGREIFDKSDVVELYPELDNMIWRQPDSNEQELIRKYVNLLIDSVVTLIENDTKFIMDTESYDLSVLCKL